MPERPRCTGTNRAGQSCGVYPLRGQTTCSAHDPTIPDEIRFGSPEQAGQAGASPKPRKLTLTQAMRERALAAADEILRPYFQALGVVGWNRDGTPIVDEAARARVAASFQGEVTLSSVEDLAAQMTASDRIVDRIEGRPRQAVEVTGEDGGPVAMSGTVDLSRLSPEQLRDLRDLLATAGESQDG